MRKQTKVVAVASAAALLAIGASMTSFAAPGWTEEAGSWYYYDSDGNRVEDDWKKSGENWFWLDSEEGGAMATDKLIEDGDDTYYVDANGAMVRGTWVMVVNEDQDDEDDPAEYNYYYFQSNGKAYKQPASAETLKKRTIDGKKYAFDSDGKMLYGWVDGLERAAGDTGWEEADYYFGDWTDGALKTGWQQITVYNQEDDEDQAKWFYFKSTGKKTVSEVTDDKTLSATTINGAKYSFNSKGVMVSKWNQVASIGEAGSKASAANWAWYGTAEDGARVNKGWFKVVPKANTFDDENDENHDDEAQWYYSDSDGTLITAEIKKIKGKYYAFNDKGAMISGLVLLNTNNGEVVTVVDDEVDSDDLDALKDDTYSADDFDPDVTRLYYFGDADNADTDGAMKTGNVTINVDGDNYAFNFTTSGGTDTKGAGTNGKSKKIYYKYGMKMAASTEDKYKAATITPDDDIVTFVSGSTIRKENTIGKVIYNENKSNQETIKYIDLRTKDLYLLGTNAQLAKKKNNGVKDGDDWYFFTDIDGKITYYANSKNFAKTDAYVTE